MLFAAMIRRTAVRPLLNCCSTRILPVNTTTKMTRLIQTEGVVSVQSKTRFASIYDAPAISELIQSFYGRDYPFPHLLRPEMVEEEIRADHIRFLIVESESASALPPSSDLSPNSISVSPLPTPTNSSHSIAVPRAIDGMLAMRTNSNNAHGCNELFGLMIRPRIREKGIGRQLVSTLTAHIESSPEFKFTMANTRASQFHVFRLFSRHGYLPVGIEPAVYTFLPESNIYQTAKETHEDFLHGCKISEDTAHARRLSPHLELPKLAHRLATIVLPVFNLDVPLLLTDSQAESVQIESSNGSLSRVLPLAVYELVKSGFIRCATNHVKQYDYIYSGGNNIKVRATCLWDSTHANLLVDSLHLDGVTTNDDLLKSLRELSAKMFEDARKSKSQSNDRNSPLSIVCAVSSEDKTLMHVLETIGYVPVAYYPALLSQDEKRVDAVRYLLMPELSQPEVANIIEKMSLSITNLSDPNMTALLHSIVRTVKSMLLESVGRLKEARSLSFQAFPPQNSVPLWSWRQFGWEDEIEAAWPRIFKEFRSKTIEERIQSAQLVQVWEQSLNYVFTFTGVDLLETHQMFPITSSILNRIPDLIGAQFTILPSGGFIAEQNNCVFEEKIRSHLGIIVPDGDVKFKIHGDELSWKEGHLFTFDDTFSHSAWNRSNDGTCVILMIDVRRPTDSRSVIEINTQQWHKWYSLLRRSSTGKNIEFDINRAAGIMTIKHSVLPHVDLDVKNIDEKNPYPGVPGDLFWYVLHCFYPQFKRSANATKQHISS